MSRKRRMNSGGPEKVLESEECLQEEETIPFGKWILLGVVNGAENRKQQSDSWMF
jgi:hypothetical protein